MNSLKSLYLLLLFMFGFNIVSAQRAILDIDTTESGVLLPRIMLTASQTFGLSKVTSNTANSMLVYNTNTATNTGLSGQGYYYWNWDETTTTGTWVKMSTGDDKGDVSLIGTSYIGANAGPGGNGTKEGTQSNRNNIFLGKSAGVSNTTGDNNIFMGYQAGDSNTFGVNNIFMGHQAGYSNESGSRNTLMGYQAGYDNSSGAGNIFIGYFAGKNNISWNNNIYLGDYAGHYNKGSGNIFLGRDAGEFLNNGTSNNTNSSNSVFIGMQTKSKEATTSNEIVIGHQAKGLGNNSAVIGNSSIAKTRLQGRVGIGTDDPKAALHVVYNNTAGNWRYSGYNRWNTWNPYDNVTDWHEWADTPDDPFAIVSDGNVLIKHKLVVAQQTVYLSDRRAKNIIGQSDSKSDLSIIDKIKITDYTKKDIKASGGRVEKKVIAQELKEVYPNAVSMERQGFFIPDVYDFAEVSNFEGSIYDFKFEKDVKVEEEVKKIQLYLKSGEEKNAFFVSQPNKKTLRLKVEDYQPNNEKVFLYGSEVYDLLMVDYDALTTLNISATQALHKKIIAQKIELEELKAQNNAILKRLEDLEKK